MVTHATHTGLVRAEGAAPTDVTARTPQILLAVAGRPKAGEVTLSPGESVFVPAGENAELSGAGTVFRATVVA